jgi:hypothetical protein
VTRLEFVKRLLDETRQCSNEAATFSMGVCSESEKEIRREILDAERQLDIAAGCLEAVIRLMDAPKEKGAA